MSSITTPRRAWTRMWILRLHNNCDTYIGISMGKGPWVSFPVSRIGGLRKSIRMNWFYERKHTSVFPATVLRAIICDAIARNHST